MEKVKVIFTKQDLMSKVKLILLNHLETIVIAITFVPLFSALVVILSTLALIGFSLQTTIRKLAQYFHPDWVGLMRGKDVAVGADDLNKPRNILLWYNTLNAHVSLQEIKNNFLEFIVNRRKVTGEFMYPKYQQYFEPWLGYNFWKWDTNFDISNHVKLLPGTSELIVTTEQQLMGKLGHLMTAPFAVKKPYWECLIVPNYVPKEEAAQKQKLGVALVQTPTPRTMVIYRMHHGIGDGYSFLKCFMQHLCHDDLEKMVTLKEGGPKDGPVIKLLKFSWAIAKVPYLLLRQCIIDIDQNVWFVPKSQLTGQCHVAQTGQISIANIKSICKTFNVSFTSVLFSALGGAINKYFKWKQFESRVDKRIPQQMSCFTPFPWRNHPNNKLINHWTCASVPIYPGIESAQERMELTEKVLHSLKQSPMPLANHLLLPIGGSLPVWAVRFGNWFNTAIVSNFPGPTQHVHYYKRYEVEDLNFWAPHLNGRAGIGVTMISYGPVMRFGLNFDKAILPHQQDVDDLCLFLEKEFEKLFQTKVTEEEVSPLKVIPEEEPQLDLLELQQRRNSKPLLRHRSVS